MLNRQDLKNITVDQFRKLCKLNKIKGLSGKKKEWMMDMLNSKLSAVKIQGNWRNKFYKELYGWKQIVKKQEKRYVYRRDGLLDEIPHVKIDRSMFLIMKRHMDRMRKFLEEWEDKIKWDKFDVLLDEEREKMLRG